MNHNYYYYLELNKLVNPVHLCTKEMSLSIGFSNEPQYFTSNLFLVLMISYMC